MTTPRNKIAAAASAFALAATLGLAAAPSAQAAPAAGTFSAPTLTGLPATMKLPASGSKHVKFSPTFSGTASDGSTSGDVNGDGAAVDYVDYHSVSYQGPRIELIKTKARKSIFAPRITAPPSTTKLRPGVANDHYYVSLQDYTTPGTYRLTFPLTQRHVINSPYARTVNTKVTTVTFNVTANKKYSRANTRISGSSWRVGKTATIAVRAPEYKAGAKATLYYKAKGRKTVKVKTKKLKHDSYQSSTTFKTKKLRRSGKVWVKVSKNAYAGKYKSAKSKITVRRY